MLHLSNNKSKKSKLDNLVKNASGDFFGDFNDLFNVYRKYKQKNYVKPISTLIPELDRFTSGGLQKGQMWVIGARPGTGKTTLALNLMWEISCSFKNLKQKDNVLFVSLEMSKFELIKKIISIASLSTNKDSTKFLNNYSDMLEGKNINSELNKKIAEVFNNELLPNNNYKILELLDDTNYEILFNLIEEAVAVKNVSCVIIDYFQLIGVGELIGTRTNQLADISKEFKKMAKRLNINVILLSQLNRDYEKKGKGNVPTLSDLKDTGSLEQDADFVGLLYENKDQSFSNFSNPNNQELSFLVAKNRNGTIGEFNLRFFREFSLVKSEETIENLEKTKKFKPSLKTHNNDDKSFLDLDYSENNEKTLGDDNGNNEW